MAGVGVTMTLSYCHSFESCNLQVVHGKLSNSGQKGHYETNLSYLQSQQQPNAKPSLTGVRIKVRKGAAKAQAKHEPQGAFPSSHTTIGLVLPSPIDHLMLFIPPVPLACTSVSQSSATKYTNILKRPFRATLTRTRTNSSTPDRHSN